MKHLRTIDSDLSTFRNENLAKILRYGSQIYGNKTNQKMFMHLIQYINDSQIFDESLFNPP